MTCENVTCAFAIGTNESSNALMYHGMYHGTTGDLHVQLVCSRILAYLPSFALFGLVEVLKQKSL